MDSSETNGWRSDGGVNAGNPQQVHKELKKYHVKRIVYTDIYGDTMFESSMVFKRMHAVGEEIIEDFVTYKVKRVALFGDMQIVNIVKV